MMSAPTGGTSFPRLRETPAAGTVVTCSAGYGVGGLGQHFAEIIDLEARAGRLQQYMTAGRLRLDGDPLGLRLASDPSRWRAWVGGLRWRTDVLQHMTFSGFDRRASAVLPQEMRRIVAFAGQALRTFVEAGKRAGVETVLHAPTAHVDHVAERHALLRRRWDIEREWLSLPHRDQARREYELADRIVVCSRYALESFLARGFKPEQMAHHEVKVSRRFVQHPFVQRSGPFRVVYCGTISASKGVPDLLEAFRQLEDPAARLTLVGYTGSRGMRRFLELAMRRDDRVVLAPGDPLPPLLEAHLYVHPSYQDGFARSALEALAARVPVIVTEDTGMKDLVVPGVNGWVVPAGDVPALAEMIRHVRRCQLVPPPLDPAHLAPAAEAAVPGRLPGSSHA